MLWKYNAVRISRAICTMFARPENTEWMPYLTSRIVTLVDGSTDTHLVMRRRLNRQWQYRRMTPEELRDAQQDWAW